MTATRPLAPAVVLPTAVIAVLYLALVAYLTLGEVPWSTLTNEARWGVLSIRSWLEPETWTTGTMFEFTANVLMFVPIGLLLRMALPRAGWSTVLGIAVAITVAIELAQIPLDRVSDPRDLVANSAGATIGVIIGAVVLALRRPARR
ncbi:MAG TPA: VanZ family protein [Rhodoglobus sp.]|nr:VanZ family protein [Rhodoglobus sp.]